MPAKINLSFVWHPLSLVIIIARVAAALVLFVDPVWGYVATVAFDYVDAIVFIHILGVSRKQYHHIDKNLDFVYFSVMLAVGVRYGLFLPLSILFVYRLIGQYFYFKTQSVMTFVFFPNFFEVVFVWGVLGKITGLTDGIGPNQTVFWLLVLFILKEGHELGLHYVWEQYRAKHR